MSGAFLVQNWLLNDQSLAVLDICVQKVKHLFSV